MELLTFALGLVFGGVIVFLITKKRNKSTSDGSGIHGGRETIDKQQ